MMHVSRCGGSVVLLLLHGVGRCWGSMALAPQVNLHPQG